MCAAAVMAHSLRIPQETSRVFPTGFGCSIRLFASMDAVA